MLFTNIDSFTYEIKSNDVYEEVFKHKHFIGKVIDKMKDVSEGKIIDGFVGLTSKMHSVTNIDGKESNIAKGVNIVTEFN